MSRALAWGISPTTDAIAAWGCRAIYHYKYALDWVPDRKDFFLPDGLDIKDKRVKDFDKFLRRAMKWADKLAEKGVFDGSKAEEHCLDDGRFHARANTNASHGYVYFGAWMEPDRTSEVQQHG